MINLLLKTCKINKTLNRCILNVRENTNKNGINLYTKLGFSQDKIIEKYYQDGENCILMEYKLKWNKFKELNNYLNKSLKNKYEFTCFK